ATTLGCHADACSGTRTCFEGRCVDICAQDFDCRPGTVCRDGMCLDGTRDPLVACPFPSMEVTPEVEQAELYVGFPFAAEGTVGETQTPCEVSSGWWVCNAP